MKKHIAFIAVPVLDTPHKTQIPKIYEEFEEWENALLDANSDNELEEIVDLITTLVNYALDKWGNKAFKAEQYKNIKDVLTRYKHMLK